ncbi:MAG: glycosyltransferase family 1 protein [Candidatus Brocadiia bacterium]|jgi:glycosyltransferase involved in cell wall biosynthesis
MIVGLDIGAQWIGARTGIGRYMVELAAWLPKAAPEARVEVFLDRPPEMVNEEEWATLRAMFPAAPLRACSGRLPVYAPSATRKARRWRVGPMLRPFDPLVQRLCAAVNEGASPWARALKRRRCPPEPGRAQVMHVMLCPSYPWRRRGNVITIHDIIPLTNPEWVPASDGRRMRAQLDFARRRCQAVITVSEFVRGQLIARGLAPERVTATPEACAPAFRPRDPGHQAACRAAAGLGPEEPFVLFVGTLDPRKNLRTLLEASAAVRSAAPHRLMVIGKNPYGPDPDLAGRDIVRLTGIEDEMLAGLMSAATLFVLPSLAEGFGLPVLEAMACGCPVITSNTTSLPEVCGDAAILVDPLDANALAERLRALLRDEPLRRDLRAKGLARAAQFSWERMARETFAVYRRVAQEDRP